MSLPEEWESLLDPGAYPHPCGQIEVIETHISWVVLTGQFAYKLKKPVRFTFVDFSTLEQREHFCREELRCNRQFAPSLYLDVVKLVRDGRRLRVDGTGEAVEWAVKMRQFPSEAQLDRMLARNALDGSLLQAFGRDLAHRHRRLPFRRLAGSELEARVLAPVRENFTDIEALPWAAPYRAPLERARSGSEAQARRQAGTLSVRLRDGWIRECHGDLHLANLVQVESGVVAFDCLEFNAALRWIDPQSDVAFLFMDCLVRSRADLGYGFLDGYLEVSGDYGGVRLLPFYAAYRSMVRAKVAALRHGQAEGAEGPVVDALEERFRSHVRWAADWLHRPPGRLILTCGLSGSGKSYVAERLVPRLPAVRLRSDVARKVLAGLTPDQPASAPVGQGLYSTAERESAYDWLALVAEDLLRSGENVIVDATFLDPSRRERFLELGRRSGRSAAVLFCDAPIELLQERIRRRAREGGDPSDADLEVLEYQRRSFVPPRGQTVYHDTGRPLDDTALADLVETLSAD